MSEIFLHGISLANFRGIGQEQVKISPFRDVNFFIGPNNVGKSTVLAFISSYLNAPKSRERWGRSFDALDVHLGRAPSEIQWGVGVPVSTFDGLTAPGETLDADLHRVIGALSECGVIWLYPTVDGRSISPAIEVHDRVKQILHPSQWCRLWMAMTRRNGGDIDQHWIPQVLALIGDHAAPTFPKVRLVPAIREVGPSGSAFDDFSGRGLIDKLAELQNPPHDQRSNHTKFRQINDFLRAVTGANDALIEVPYDRRHLLVHMDGRVLPLSSLGTGIHEVIMMASFCTLVENEIVCIEEPEIHLHPLLQKKFLRYLCEHTSNQYFVATHSASLIDSVDAAVFAVRKDVDQNVVIDHVVSSETRYEICRELGYRASDILQSNAVIWVEGPSDRIYVKHWIALAAPELVEGIDYSIMFYGGRLLSHLSGDSDDLSEFICLRRMNRNSIVVMDSDKSSNHARINDTKKRIFAEFGEGHAWITSGREIENYVHVDAISEALRRIYPERFGGIASADKFSHRLHFTSQTGALVTDADKVRVAKAAVEVGLTLDELDLKKRIGAVVEMIRSVGR